MSESGGDAGSETDVLAHAVTSPGLSVTTINVPSVQTREAWWSLLELLMKADGLVVLRPTSSAEFDQDGYLHTTDYLSQVFEVIDCRRLPMVTVCQGPLRGSMLLFPAMSSVVLATTDSTFGFPSMLKDAVHPQVAVAMKARVTEQIQKRLMLVGDTVDAVEAQRFGLVDFVGDEEAVENELARIIFQHCSSKTQHWMSKTDMIKTLNEREAMMG